MAGARLHRSIDEPANAASAAVLTRLAPYLSIAHHVPGRIRLKLDEAAIGDPQLRAAGERLRAALAGLRGLRSIRLNVLARSCIVEYDNGVIPDEAWPDLLAGRDTRAAETLFALLRECACSPTAWPT